MAMTERATRTAGRAGDMVLDAARRLPRDTARLAAATGRAAVEVVRHPEAVLDRARRLPLAVPMLRQAVMPILTGRVDGLARRVRLHRGHAGVHLRFPLHLQRPDPA